MASRLRELAANRAGAALKQRWAQEIPRKFDILERVELGRVRGEIWLRKEGRRKWIISGL